MSIELKQAELTAKKDELDAQNKKLGDYIQQLEQAKNDLKGMWAGEASDAYNDDFQQSIQKFTAFSDLVTQYVAALNTIIEKYSSAEAANVGLV